MSTVSLTRPVYFDYARSALGSRGESRLRHQMSFLYHGISFRGKRVLDVGGGAGRHTFYAAASGAEEVVTIEPEGDGGHDAMHDSFEQWRVALGAANTHLVDSTMQTFIAGGQHYDIVLIQDAINHFDEPACIELHRSEASRRSYAAIFRSIADLISPGGILVLSDCSSRNLFPALGMQNPIDPAIEWHKHQPPEIWVGLAEEASLRRKRLRWSSPARFGAVGSALLGNRMGAYFFTSHFVIDFRKEA